MIDPQVILKQVSQGDLPDNWRVFRYTGFSLKTVVKVNAIYMLSGLLLTNTLFNLLFRGLAISNSSLLLDLYWIFAIFAGSLAAWLSAWQREVASLLVIVPEGMIHVVNQRYLEARCSLFSSEGGRRRADYRSTVGYSFSKHVYGWYPCNILPFADIASMQLKVSYMRGSWLELYYHNGERKKLLIEPYLDSAAVECAQSAIIAHTRYVTEHPQIIGQE
jgi:hypothetical protein